MKDLFYCLLIILVFYCGYNFSNRYTIVGTNSGTFLLDAKTGLSWMQVAGNDNTGLYWQEMDAFGLLENNVVKGKEKEHKKLQNKLLK